MDARSVSEVLEPLLCPERLELIRFKECICLINRAARETGNTEFQCLMLIGFIKGMPCKPHQRFDCPDIQIQPSAYRNDGSHAWTGTDILFGFAIHFFTKASQATEMRLAHVARLQDFIDGFPARLIDACDLSSSILTFEFSSFFPELLGQANNSRVLLCFEFRDSLISIVSMKYHKRKALLCWRGPYRLPGKLQSAFCQMRPSVVGQRI